MILIILAAVLYYVLFYLLLQTKKKKEQDSTVQALIFSLCGTTLYLYVITEVLSQFKALHFSSVLWCWIGWVAVGFLGIALVAYRLKANGNSGVALRSAGFSREMADKVLNRHVDMVVGDRLSSTYFTENKRPFHNFGNTLVRGCINSMFHSNIKDIMTGYRAFSYQFVKTFPVLSKGFEIETEMSIHAIDKNMLVENVVIEYRDRPEGSESKLNTYSDGFKVLKTITRLYKNYKPLKFFSVLAAVLCVIGLAFFIPVLVAFIKTGMVEKIPTLIVSCFVILAAIQAFFSGLILSTLTQKNRHDFEMQLIHTQRDYNELKQKAE